MLAVCCEFTSLGPTGDRYARTTSSAYWPVLVINFAIVPPPTMEDGEVKDTMVIHPYLAVADNAACAGMPLTSPASEMRSSY